MAFNRDNRSGGGGRSFGRRRFDGDRGADRQMFPATCSNCGKQCEVPFQPTGSKPVYCSDCFRTMGDSDSRRSDDRGSRRSNFDSRGSSQPQYREQFEALNTKLDKILSLLASKPAKSQSAVAKEPEATQVEEVQAPALEEAEMVEQPIAQSEEQVLIPEKKTRAPRKTTIPPVLE